MGNTFKRKPTIDEIICDIKTKSHGTYIIGIDEPNIRAFYGVNGLRGVFAGAPPEGYVLNPDFMNIPENKDELIRNKEIEAYNNLVAIHNKYKNKEINRETANKLGIAERENVDDYKWSLDPPKYIKI